MKLTQSDQFIKNVAGLDGSIIAQLHKVLDKVVARPELGKPLRHFPNARAERVGGFRLIYFIRKDDVYLLCFKKRDDVYECLARLGHQAAEDESVKTQ